MTQPRGRARVGWELLRVLQESLMALEETASRVLAAQVAGTIALWTQLYTFEGGPPEVLAWIALFVFVGSLSYLGLFLRPRRLIRFWDRAIPDELFAARKPVTQDEETWAIDHISTTMRRHRDQLERAIGIALPLGVFAMILTLVAYAIDKALFPP